MRSCLQNCPWYFGECTLHKQDSNHPEHIAEIGSKSMPVSKPQEPYSNLVGCTVESLCYLIACDSRLHGHPKDAARDYNKSSLMLFNFFILFSFRLDHCAWR